MGFIDDFFVNHLILSGYWLNMYDFHSEVPYFWDKQDKRSKFVENYPKF